MSLENWHKLTDKTILFVECSDSALEMQAQDPTGGLCDFAARSTIYGKPQVACSDANLIGYALVNQRVLQVTTRTDRYITGKDDIIEVRTQAGVVTFTLSSPYGTTCVVW